LGISFGGLLARIAEHLLNGSPTKSEIPHSCYVALLFSLRHPLGLSSRQLVVEPPLIALPSCCLVVLAGRCITSAPTPPPPPLLLSPLVVMALDVQQIPMPMCHLSHVDVPHFSPQNLQCTTNHHHRSSFALSINHHCNDKETIPIHDAKNCP
jgi:hypothetical protein